MGKGRKKKYSQPKSNPLYIKLTDYGRFRLKEKAFENNLSEGELIEQFARSRWLTELDLIIVLNLLIAFRKFLAEEFRRNPEEASIVQLLLEINQIIEKIK